MSIRLLRRAVTIQVKRCLAGFLVATLVWTHSPLSSAQEPRNDYDDQAGFGEWQPALPGWEYEFPRDHHAHPDFRTEWWYFTGNARATNGRRFGYQLTFFRSGVIPPRRMPENPPRFLVGDFKFAHFAVSDLEEGRFYFSERRGRGAFGEAGFNDGARVAWIEDWTLTLTGPDDFHLQANDLAKGIALDLHLKAEAPKVFHGADGVSPKDEAAGNATHYYTIPRFETRRLLRTPSGEFSIEGQSWLDREWGSNLLGADQTGWDWFSIQLSDGSGLMLFQIREKGGGIASKSAGTWIRADGSSEAINPGEFSLVPGRTWKSKSSGGIYPVEWQLTVPRLSLDLKISTPLDAQELAFGVINYWEGAIDVQGSIGEKPATGVGYLEMTGYAGAIVGLRQMD